MEIDKSTRHAKLIGDCGEAVICNWLSRSGFEVVLVDHTGIDIVAYHVASGRRLGLTVKSRTRTAGTESGAVYVFREAKKDRKKVLDACQAFGCEPWLAVYVETGEGADVYLTSLRHYDAIYRRPGTKIDRWGMGQRNRETYARDRAVRHLSVSFAGENWTWSNLARRQQRL